jgi:hypothetical protein
MEQKQFKLIRTTRKTEDVTKLTERLDVLRLMMERHQNDNPDHDYALSGLIIAFDYTAKGEKLESDRHLMSAGFFTVLALAIGSTGKFLEGKKP